MNRSTKTVTAAAMFCALAYAAAAVGRFPLVLFLKYDPKDIVIAISGFALGPAACFATALAASLLELLTVSENGVLGLMMNVISSCSFACTAALVHQKRPGFSGALRGLLFGWACMALVMLFWNYLIAPVYMGCSRQAVAELLLPVFLPFNLIKGGLNTAGAALLYRPAAVLWRDRA